MSEETKLSLEDLVGPHKLTAVEFAVETPNTPYSDPANTIAFELDGVVYVATEDPSDGYRSCMKAIERLDTILKNKFECDVIARMSERAYAGRDDVLELVDVQTGKVVLSVGTRDTDDYYPSFCAEFEPKNMAVNQQ